MYPLYRFGVARNSASGQAKMPHRHQNIERQHADGTWETIGYVEIHLHRVKVDERDIEDISVGVTVRINPKP